MNAPQEVKKLTSKQRLVAIKAGLVGLLQRLPAGWQDWSSERLAIFKADVEAARTAGSVKKLLPIASRIAGVYGAQMATIDPDHGDAP